MSRIWGKRLLCLCSILAIVGSVTLWGGRSFAARQPGPVHAARGVRLCTSLPFSSVLSALSHGIDNSVRLATEQWTKRFRAAHLNLLPPLSMDDGGGTSWD